MQKAFSFLAFIGALALLTACSSPRQMALFQSAETSAFAVPETAEPLIEPNDKISVYIAAIDPEAVAPYRNLGTEFRVSDDGDIILPVAGVIHVAGLTERQAADVVQSRVAVGVVKPVVQVTNQSLFVTILGEVQRPNVYPIRPILTLPGLLGLAGGLTPNGRTDNVLVIRKEGGKLVEYRLSLSDNSLFASPCYWLHRDDVVIISPRHSRHVN